MVATARASLPLYWSGPLAPLSKMARAVAHHVPRRRLGGWATVWALLGADGSVQPVVDRDGQTMDCAAEITGIDWSGYLREGGGHWNAYHDHNLPIPLRGQPGNRRQKVGISTLLEYHDTESPFAREHRKVGWWTAGHLWDREDPDSWRLYTSYVPTAEDLALADHFWTVAQRLGDTDRGLGFSVDGRMRTSPCGKRIIWAGVSEMAIAEVPANPASSVEVLELAKAAAGGAELRELVLTKAPRLDAGASSPCGACRCGPNACQRVLRKSFAADVAALAPASMGATAASVATPAGPSPIPLLDRLKALLVNRYWLDEPTAARVAPQLLAVLQRRRTRGTPMAADPITDLLNAADEVLAKGTAEDVAKILDEADAELAKAAGDADPGEEEELAKEDEETGDEDSEAGEDEGDEDEGDEDEMAKAAMEFLGQLGAVPAAVAELSKAVGLLGEAIGAMAGRVGALEKSMTPCGAELSAIRGEVVELQKSHAAGAAASKALVQAVRGLAENVTGTQELVKGLLPTPASRAESPAAANAAALSRGLGFDPHVPDEELSKQAKAAAAAAFSAGRIDSIALNQIFAGTADIHTCRKAIGA